MAIDYPVIPAPANYEAVPGSFTVPDGVIVVGEHNVDYDMLDAIVSALKISGVDVSSVRSMQSFADKRKRMNYDGDISFAVNDTIPAEGYDLSITPDRIFIEASSQSGFFYAVQTLAQMLAKSDSRTLAACHIYDFPRFPYRSIMLDPSRWFIPKEEILKMIDVAAAMKINNLHLHLSDDNGWRLEIKKYPRLTEVGAWRVDREEYFPGRLNPSEGEPTPIGGFYTQDDMRDIVRYAADRHIRVIPEIDVPAHSAAAIASYPELACPVTDKFVGVFPGIGGPDASIILCAGNENVYEFYRNVLDEIMDIFPSEYIHLGGDEAEKSHWKQCPLCNKKKEQEGLADFEELQGYFMDQLSSYVRSKGRTPLAWDEVTHGKPKEDMVIMGWNGYGQAAIDYAQKTGSRFILTPAKVMYFIRYQGPQWFEPFTYFGNATLKDVYTFEPVKPDWSPEMRKQLLGVQGSLWSEFITGPEHLEYQMFPRAVALADLGWRPEGASDWQAFLSALDEFTPLLDARGITYARSMFNLDHKVVPYDKCVNVTLSCIRPDVEIRYSLDDPSLIAHTTYTQPLKIDRPGHIYASTFRNGRREGRTLTLNIDFNDATGASVDSPNCNNSLAEVLTNGLRGSERNSDFEWAGWHNRDARFTVDLGEAKPLGSVKLGTLSNSHICIAAPRKVSVYTSVDGSNFDLLKTVELPDDIVWHKGALITDIDFGDLGSTSARYLKFEAENPGVVPDGFARATAPTWIYFDEVIIN